MANRTPDFPPASIDRSRSVLAPATSIAVMPARANGANSMDEEFIWKRLREAGFDEGTVKRRDKAALIAYVTKLEEQLYEYQCNLGIILLENKETQSKYELLKSSSESTEIMHKHENAANISALAESRKREENLMKSIGIETECLADKIERTLHQMRAQSAEGKVAYEIKEVEAQSLMETAQRMIDEAKTNAYELKASQAEADRLHNTALRMLQDVEVREDDLRGRVASFKQDCDSKEKEISLQRKSLTDSQKIIHQDQDMLMEGQRIMSQREEHIYLRLKDLSHSENELMEARLKLEEERTVIREEKNNFDLAVADLSSREKALMEREALLDKKDRDTLLLQKKISDREFAEIKNLKEDLQSSFERKIFNFEVEMAQKRESLEEGMIMERDAINAKNTELERREQKIIKIENSVQTELHSLSDKQEDVIKRLQLIEEKEKLLLHSEKMVELKMSQMQSEKEEINKMQQEFVKVKSSLENMKKDIFYAGEKVAVTSNERNELLIMQRRLKEEIDSFITKKTALDFEGDNLKSERKKFEDEWDLIDEKREELRKEADRIAMENRNVSIYLRTELNTMNSEKNNFRSLFKKSTESFNFERDDFMRKMEYEQSDCSTKLLKERDNFLNDMNLQRKELEESIFRRREEVESYLREKEEAFEEEKTKELQIIASQKEEIGKQLEFAVSESKLIANQRADIARDLEQRVMETSELSTLTEELNAQREKLQKQRELLHEDRKEIDKQIDHLLKLQQSQFELECKGLNDSNTIILARQTELHKMEEVEKGDDSSLHKIPFSENASSYSSPPSAPLNWFSKFAMAIFKLSPERNTDTSFHQGTENRLLAALKLLNGNSKHVKRLEFKSKVQKKSSNSMEVAFFAASKEEHRSHNRSSNQYPLRKRALIDVICSE